MSSDVERYSRIAPLPYSLQAHGGITYETFFAGSDEDLARAKAFIHGRPDQPRRYSPGGRHNWESQHPPLYYLMLSPVYASTRHMSWTTHLLALRLASYVLAWAALLIGVYACLTAVPSTLNGTRATWEWAALGIGLWPLVLPSWFPDMARIGNDSMCAFILAGVWWLTIRASHNGLSVGYAVALGALLGAGCLTKVFFVPVTVACLGFWSVRAWTLGGLRSLASHIPRMTMVLLVTGAIAGWWYLWNWREYGVPSGGLELIELWRRGGLLSGLAQHASPLGLLKAPVDLGVTLVWPGTWSLVGAGISWAQVMLFSGLEVWYGDDNIRAYSPPALFQGVLELSEALTRLAVLAHPWVGLAAWLVGGALVLVGLARAWNAAFDLERRVEIES